MFLASGLSDVGCKRSSNQDRLSVDLPGLIFVVADGMGGQNCGEVAAEIAVKTVSSYLRHPAESPDVRMGMALILANQRIREEAQNMPQCAGMGSTIAATMISGRTATIGNVGDSRVYLLRGGQLGALTKDDSVVAKLLDAGEISADEARTHPMRNVLTQAAGKVDKIEPRVQQLQLMDADRLLLCSDGLHGVVGHDAITNILDSGDDVEATVRRLVSEGRKLGAPDNLSCVVIEFLSEG